MCIYTCVHLLSLVPGIHEIALLFLPFPDPESQQEAVPLLLLLLLPRSPQHPDAAGGGGGGVGWGK
jgi:hypothetical protein